METFSGKLVCFHTNEYLMNTKHLCTSLKKDFVINLSLKQGYIRHSMSRSLEVLLLVNMYTCTIIFPNV